MNKKIIFYIFIVLAINTIINIASADSINIASQSGEIFLKNITYNINYQFVPTRNNLMITGQGIDKTILDFGNSNLGQIYINGLKNIMIRNLTLKSQNGIGISRLLFNNSRNIILRNVKIDGGGKYFLNWAVFFSTNNRDIIIDNVTTINTEDSPIRTFSKGGLYNANITITNYTNLGNAAGYYEYGNGDGIDLYGSRNVSLKYINIYNVGSNGIGIYADAKNIVGSYIYEYNIGGSPTSISRGSGIALERWSDLDPCCVQFDNVYINQSWGHGIRLITRKTNWNNYPGTISDVTITNYNGENTWWSGFSLEGGNVDNILLSNFIIGNTNVGNGGSPVIYFDSSSYNNVLIKDGIFLPPFIQDGYIPPGVTITNVTGFNYLGTKNEVIEIKGYDVYKQK